MKKTVERVFLGYVLVKMVLTDESWHLVHNVRGAAGLPTRQEGDSPDRTGNLRPRRRASRSGGYELGDSVKITDGSPEALSARWTSSSLDKDRVRVVVSMFGRDAIDLELDQVEA